MNEAHQREAAIFDAAVELPPEQRAAHLDQACGGDAALRRRIESLLKAHESRCEFLDSPSGPELRPTLQIPVSFTEKPGDRIGRYKLLEQIGEGGCGVVYVAEQTEPVRRRVALKVIKLGMDTKSVIARFEAERQALALMDHPNIAKVFDAGATNTGRPYFVMELVRGMKITDYCDEKKLSTDARLDLFIRVCQAIQHAHQKGIIHRDIKPSNILVTVNDGVAVPKVIDFGVAKATGGQVLTDKTVYTAFEQFIGTPAYMSPEQAVLTSLDIDTRSDIYALGVLLYELLTGRTPFDPKELLAVGLDEMRRTIREKEPDRPSMRVSTLPGQDLNTTAHRRGLEPHKLVSELRGDLDWIVMKCLEKDRARRYETANGLAMDIQRHLSDEPVVARPPSKLYEFQKTVRRHKIGFAATAAVIVALGSGLAVAGWMFAKERAAVREQSRLRQQAQAGEQKAQTEAAKSQQVAQFLQDMLQAVGPSVAAGRDTELLQEILDRTEERLDNELANQPEVEAQLRNVIGSVYFELGQSSQAEAMFARSLALLREVFSDDHVTVADTLHNLAEVQRRFGSIYEIEEAEAYERQALAIYQEQLGRQSGKVGAALNVLGQMLNLTGKRAEAETVLREALEVNRREFGEESPQVGLSLSRLGDVLTMLDQLDEAESVLREAVRVQRNAPTGVKQFGLVAPEVELGWTLLTLSGALEKQGKLSESETNLNEAVAVLSEVLPKDHPDRLSLLRRQAKFHARHGQNEQAKTEYRELLAVYTSLAATSENPPTLNSAAWTLATATYPELRDGSNAVLFAEKAVAATSRKNPSFLDTLAAAYAEAGQFAKAVTTEKEAMKLVPVGGEYYRLFAQSLSLYEASIPYRDSGEMAVTVTALLQSGRFAEAEPGAREYLRLREKLLPHDWRTFNAQSLLGGSLLGQGNYPEAEPLLLAGYEGMIARTDEIPPKGRSRLKEALQRLVQLYEETDRPERGAEWKQKLAEFKESLLAGDSESKAKTK